MKSKFFSPNRHNVTAFITILVMIALLASYYFVYVPQRENQLRDEEFRTLTKLTKNVQSQISDDETLVDRYWEELTDHDNYNEKMLRTYLNKSFSGTDSKLSLKIVKLDSSNHTRRERIYLDAERDAVFINSLNYLDSYKRRPDKAGDGKPDINDSLLQARININDFFEPLLNKYVFDEYIFFQDDHTVYQTFQAGISYDRTKISKSLFKDSAELVQSTVRDISIGGVPYKMMLQPTLLGGDSKIIIAGLIKTKNFNARRMNLPNNVIIWLILLTLLALLLFPTLKLGLMGNREQLDFRDLISLYLSSLLLMMITWLLLIKYFFHPPSPDGAALKNLSASIDSAFHKEIDSAYTQLSGYDALISTHNSLQNNITRLCGNKTKVRSGTCYLPSVSANKKPCESIASSLLDSVANLAKYYQYITQVYWLDDTAKEQVNWSTSNMNSPSGPPVYYRDYFKKVVDNATYSLHGDTSKRYYLDPLVSHTTGSFRVVISIPSSSKAYKVACMSCDFSSVYKAVMPEGFSFAIVREDGDVLFHSDATRNLNENLLEECDDDDKVRGALKETISDSFSVNYGDVRCLMYITPIKDLPYKLVVYSDSSYDDVQSAETFSITLSYSILLFIFITLQLMLVVLTSGGFRFLKRRQISIDVLYPSLRNRTNYQALLLIHVLLLLEMLFTYARFINQLDWLNILMIILSAIIASTAAWNVSFLCLPYADKVESIYRTKNIMNPLLLLSGLYLLLMGGGMRLLNFQHMYFLWFQLAMLMTGTIIFGVYFFVCRKHNKRINPDRSKSLDGNTDSQIAEHIHVNKRKSHNHSFSFMLFFRFMLICGVPVLFIYTHAYDQEQMIIARIRHLALLPIMKETYADSFTTAQPVKMLESNPGKPKKSRTYVYTDNVWVDILKASADHSSLTSTNAYDSAKEQCEHFWSNSKTDRTLATAFRIHFDSLSQIGDGLVNECQATHPDLLQSWNNSMSTSILYSPVSHFPVLKINTAPINFLYKFLNSWFFRLLPILLAFFLLYRLMRYWIMKIFGVGFPRMDKTPSANDMFFRDLHLMVSIDKIEKLLTDCQKIPDEISETETRTDSSHQKEELRNRYLNLLKENNKLLQKCREKLQGYAGSNDPSIPTHQTKKLLIDKIESRLNENTELKEACSQLAGDPQRDGRELEIFHERIISHLMRAIDNLKSNAKSQNRNFYINGTPGSGKTNYVKDALKENGVIFQHDDPAEINGYVLDLIEVPDADSLDTDQQIWDKVVAELRKENHRFIVINHFEYNVRDQHTNRIKLNLIENLLLEKKRFLFINSTIHQEGFIHSLERDVSQGAENESAGKAKEEGQKAKSGEKKAIKEDILRWTILLGHFVNLYKPLEENKGLLDAAQEKGEVSIGFRQIIKRECLYGDFLDKVAPQVLEFVKVNGWDNECFYEYEQEVILKIQSLAHLFYLNIWESLSHEERFIVYDLAGDGLLNTSDTHHVSMLLQKGIIINEGGQLKLFNRSFANFVLTAVSHEDIKKIEKEVKDTGTWTSLRIPLIIVLLGAAMFLLISQQETYFRIISYLTALTTGIPLVIRLFSSFGPGSQKSSGS